MIDLTQIGTPPNAKQNPLSTPEKPRVVTRPSQPPVPENLQEPQNDTAKAFRSVHWTPDKFVQDGQIAAGEIDEAQQQFLKNTEFIPDDSNG